MERKAFELLHSMENSWWYRGRATTLQSALRRCKINSVEVVLDFGAGYGGMYEELRRVSQQVYAFEPDMEAQKALTDHGYAGVHLAEDKALESAYDLIGLFDVLEHIEGDLEFLKKAHKALQNGGHIAITVPAFPFLWSTHDVDHYHFRRYTKASMRRVLNEAGFEVEYMSYWNATLFIPAAIMRLIGRSGESALAMPRVLDMIFYGIVRLESLIIRIGSLPFGTGLVVVARKK